MQWTWLWYTLRLWGLALKTNKHTQTGYHQPYWPHGSNWKTASLILSYRLRTMRSCKQYEGFCLFVCFSKDKQRRHNLEMKKVGDGDGRGLLVCLSVLEKKVNEQESELEKVSHAPTSAFFCPGHSLPSETLKKRWGVGGTTIKLVSKLNVRENNLTTEHKNSLIALIKWNGC